MPSQNNSILTNILLTVAYEGTNFYGFQKTATGRSVETELEEALVTILQHEIKLQGASRTDRGVHAQGQVVNFLTPKSVDLFKLKRSLNQLLPEDLCIINVECAPSPDFHPTLDAKAKEYHYYINYHTPLLPHLRTTYWHIPSILDLDAMKSACLELSGLHDFKAFCNERKGLSYKDTMREIMRLEIVELEKYRLRIEIVGKSFLYKMARNISGMLAYIGMGKCQLRDLATILAQKNRIHAGITAPACGLFLHKVYY